MGWRKRVSDSGNNSTGRIGNTKLAEVTGKFYATRPWRKSCQWSEGTRPQIQYGQQWRVAYDINAITAKPTDENAGVEAFFTSKGDTLYAVLPRWPSQPLVLKDVRPTSSTAVTLLGQERALKWDARGPDILITMPNVLADQRACTYAYALKITQISSVPSRATSQ